MRRNLLHFWYKELSYAIREIVAVAEKVESFWQPISWENIGDPVEKWEKIPTFMKAIISEALTHDEVYGYSPSKWLLKTREYIAAKTNIISPEDIIFFNGIGEAINKTYGYLAASARVLWPNPAYPTHSSAEATNSWSEHLTYQLDPNNDWNPDIDEIENKVKYNPNIAAILVINPDNPTWAVFKKSVLESIVDIAKRYNLFLIFDEIYCNLVYDPSARVMLSDIIWDVPGISMKWISKDLPWPWARCGWMEIYNQDKDENFRKYIASIYGSKMLEVCSTTLPQYVLPEIYESPEFEDYKTERLEKYRSRADMAEDILGDLREIIFVKPKGAFYLSIVFDMDHVDEDKSVLSNNAQLDDYMNGIIDEKARFDARFCYRLLAASWICVVPLSGFNSTHQGFRITLLEESRQKFRDNLEKIRDFIIKYKK